MARKKTVSQSHANAAKVAASTTVPEEGAFYYVDGDNGRAVGRCVAVLNHEGQDHAVLANGEGAQMVHPDNLRRIPTTAGEVLRVVGLIEHQLDDIDAAGAALSSRAVRAHKTEGEADIDPIDTATVRRLLTSLDVWARGIPGIPASELA